MLSGITALVLASLSAPVVIEWFSRRGWVDNPTTQKHVKKIHLQPIPRGGGVIVAIAIVLPALLLIPLSIKVTTLLLGVGLLALVGWLDDVYDIHPGYRLAVNILVALLAVAAGISVEYVTNPVGPGVWWLSSPLLAGIPISVGDLGAFIFLIWNMNSLNWSNGVDGQLPGYVTISALLIGVVALGFAGDPRSEVAADLSWMVAGAFAGLLIWNHYPQHLITGYGAGSIAGFTLGALSIMSGAKIAVTLAVLAIPTADALFTITRRVIAGKKPWWGDRGHLHHKLIDVWRWPIPRIASGYWIASLVLGGLSLYLPTQGKIMLVALVFVAVWTVLIISKIKSMQGTP